MHLVQYDGAKICGKRSRLRWKNEYQRYKRHRNSAAVSGAFLRPCKRLHNDMSSGLEKFHHPSAGMKIPQLMHRMRHVTAQAHNWKRNEFNMAIVYRLLLHGNKIQSKFENITSYNLTKSTIMSSYN